MTNSSDRSGPPHEKATGRPESSRPPSGGRAPQGGDPGGHPYARFIPREELEGFAAWRPDAFGDSASAHSPAAEAGRHAAQQSALQAARHAGYQDGYRDGLVGLENFKRTFAQQMTAQLAPLVADFDRAFLDLETQIAASVALAATALAHQVVRSELVARPALVAQVAAEAVNAVLLSARHIRLFVHPQDHALVQEGAGETLTARGARLLTDATLTPGGCRVESDLGQIDARIETRWAQAAGTLGHSMAFDAEPAQ